MVVITDDPDPTFASRFEPEALMRERCAVCAVAMAVLRCSACALQFCVSCEREAHDATRQQQAAVKLELEETKSAENAPLIHQEHVVAVNLCQACTLKTVEFLCLDCGLYQCEECCAGRHLHSEGFSAHLFFCVDGSSPRLLRFAQWSPEFMEMAKMSHRVMLQRREDERAAAAQVKQEAADAAAAMAAAEDERPPAEPIHDMEALSIDEAPAAVKPEPSIASQQQPPPPSVVGASSIPEQKYQLSPPPPAESAASSSPPQVKPELTQASVPPADSTEASPAPPQTPQTTKVVEAELPSEPSSSSMKPEVPSTPATAVPTGGVSSSTSVVVDLTEDDDESEGVKPEPAFSTSFGRLGVTEQPVKRESSAWLQAAASSLTAAAGGSSAADSILLEDDDMDDDPIKRTMVGEYNRVSEAIFNHEQEMAAIQKQIKDLLANRTANMHVVVKLSNAAAQVKTRVAAETHNRNAAVARLVVYLKQDRAELDALLGESSVDIPHIQAASHRRCAQLEAVIRDRRFEIRQLKRSMEETISMKASTPFEEVSRLGALVVAAEQAVRESEEARVVELIRLVQFSEDVRAAARAMATS